jgi:hypothetical protein
MHYKADDSTSQYFGMSNGTGSDAESMFTPQPSLVERDRHDFIDD